MMPIWSKVNTTPEEQFLLVQGTHHFSLERSHDVCVGFDQACDKKTRLKEVGDGDPKESLLSLISTFFHMDASSKTCRQRVCHILASPLSLQYPLLEQASISKGK